MATGSADAREADRGIAVPRGQDGPWHGGTTVDAVCATVHDVKDHALSTVDQARASLGANYEQLKRDLDVLRGQLAALGADAGEEARLRLSDGLDAMTAQVDALSRDARKLGGRKLEEAERLIQERPLTSVLVSFGLGMLFARLLGR